MSRTTKQCIDRVTVGTFEEVTRQAAIRLHMPDDWLHRISALELSVYLFGYPPPGSGNPDLQLALSAAMAFVAPICLNLLGRNL